jgi:hypothetical protein
MAVHPLNFIGFRSCIVILITLPQYRVKLELAIGIRNCIHHKGHGPFLKAALLLLPNRSLADQNSVTPSALCATCNGKQKVFCHTIFRLDSGYSPQASALLRLAPNSGMTEWGNEHHI